MEFEPPRRRMIFTGPEIARFSGMSYVRLNTLIHEGALRASIRGSERSGVHRRFSFADLVAAIIVVRAKHVLRTHAARRRMADHVVRIGSRALLAPDLGAPLWALTPRGACIDVDSSSLAEVAGSEGGIVVVVHVAEIVASALRAIESEKVERAEA